MLKFCLAYKWKTLQWTGRTVTDAEKLQSVHPPERFTYTHLPSALTGLHSTG